MAKLRILWYYVPSPPEVESDDKKNSVYKELHLIKDQTYKFHVKFSLGDSRRSGEMALFF